MALSVTGACDEDILAVGEDCNCMGGEDFKQALYLLLTRGLGGQMANAASETCHTESCRLEYHKLEVLAPEPCWSSSRHLDRSKVSVYGTGIKGA